MPGNGVGTSTGGIGSIIGLVLGLALLCLVIAMISSGGGNIPPVPTPAPTIVPSSTDTPSAAATNAIPINFLNTPPDPKIETAIARGLESKKTDDLSDGTLALPCSKDEHISVWAPGYYILTFVCGDNPTVPYDVKLDPVIGPDNPNYSWVGAQANLGQQNNCENCHNVLKTDLAEYPAWIQDGHSRSFSSLYFRTTYLGTNSAWQPSQQIQWTVLENGQKIYPLLDPMQPDYGAGYRLDYPVSNGNCAFCHVPAAAPGTLQEENIADLMRSFSGIHSNAVTEGVTCEICHKATDVLVEKNSRLPYDDRPGILSMSILRPISDLHFVYGPLAFQSVLGSSSKRTCFPVFSESKLCAACHYAKFANTQIYGSYKEWLDTPYYSNRGNSTFRSCQDCHMPNPPDEPGANTVVSQRDACTLTNVDSRNFSHNMMDYGTDKENPARQIPRLIQGAAQIKLEPTLASGQISVKVSVINTGAGHKFPTDSPLRHLILRIEARDWRENLLTQSGGPTIPVWAAPDLGGYPGQIYANVLKDKDTNLAPSFAYWNPVEPAWQGADTRLPPLVAVQSVYSFAAPYDRWATIKVQLIYRKAFMNVAQKKGWPLEDLDIKVTEVELKCSGFGADPQTMTCEPVSIE